MNSPTFPFEKSILHLLICYRSLWQRSADAFQLVFFRIGTSILSPLAPYYHPIPIFHSPTLLLNPHMTHHSGFPQPAFFTHSRLPLIL